MAKKQNISEKEEESPVESPIKVMHRRSYRDIVEAGQKRVATGNEDNGEPIEEKEEPEKEVEEKEVKEVEAPKETPVDFEKKIQEGIDKAIAERTAKEVKVDTTEADKRVKEIQDKKDYQYSWVTEKRTPKDYTEIAEETRKKVSLGFEAKAMEQEDADKVADTKAESEKTATVAQQTAQTEAINKNINDELEDLYVNEKLPRIKDEKDPNDEGLVARNALFQAGITVNQERLAKGEAPITSISRIFLNYYKPAEKEQPAGEDAPIVENKSSEEPSDEQVKYSDIHRKSFRQIFAEARARAMGKK